MSDRGSISRLLAALQDGDPRAADGLVPRYFDKLARMADRRLRRAGAKLRIADGHDIALVTLHTVLAGVRQGKYPDLTDRQQLWGLLFRVMKDEAWKQGRWERAKKRGGGKVRGDSAFDKPGASVYKGLDDIAAIEPTPEDMDQLASTVHEFLDWLDEDVRQVVILHLVGFKQREIAEQCDCSVSTVERRIKFMRAAIRERIDEEGWP